MQIVIAAVLVGGVLSLGPLFSSTPAQTPPVRTADQSAPEAPAQSEPAASPQANSEPAAPEEMPADGATATTDARPPDQQQEQVAEESAAPPASQETQPAESADSVPAATDGETPAEPSGHAGHATAANSVDLEAGRQAYRKCQACHALEPGRHRLGPSLAGVFGRAAAALPDYNYSAAMRESGLVWDAATLDAYLENPQKVIPGNKMPFPGMKTENQRREVIAYLQAETEGSLATAQAQPAAPAATPTPVTPATRSPSVKYISDVRYTLRTREVDGEIVYVGDGGTIDGIANPELTAVAGQVVQITLVNGEAGEHDIVFPDQATRSPRIYDAGSATTIAFRASDVGEFAYYSSVPGQREAGMEGTITVTEAPPPELVVQADISRQPDDLPPPIGDRGPETVRLDLVTVEQEARLADGTTYTFWTFNGRVPGPFVRVRVGDTVEVHLKNADDSSLIHSVDFHAATGPGGGAAATQVDPGDEKSVKFKALIPGLYVYHCATPMVAHHIASGMYGLILVEPEGGLPPVDREFYVMQGEVYTEADFGQHGSQEFSVDKLLDEDPEYFTFNGSVGAISQLHPLQANVGETVRIYFGVGGPNYTSSFHVIGEIFDKVYNLGDVISAPAQGVQTVLVPPGGATIAEFELDVPGTYILVDHALSRAERGLVGTLHVEGPENKEIFDGVVTPGMGH